MCGRFEQHVAKMHGWVDIIDEWPTDAERQFDIRPTNTALTFDAEGWKLRRWSLVPAWSKTLKLKYATFNARSESLVDKPVFRGAWKHSQRCLVPASAYFEWSAHEGEKACYVIERVDKAPLMFGGLWESWKGEEGAIETFTIITTEALPEISHLHHRSPLFLDELSADVWLHGAPEEAAGLMAPKSLFEFAVREIANPRTRDNELQ